MILPQMILSLPVHRKITVAVFGSPTLQVGPLELSLDYKHDVLNVTGKGCGAIPPSASITTTNPAGQPAEFFVAPLDLGELSKTTAVITPMIMPVIGTAARGQQSVDARELAFTIQLEDPIWKLIRDLCKYGLGVTTVPAFLWALFDRARKKR